MKCLQIFMFIKSSMSVIYDYNVYFCFAIYQEARKKIERLKGTSILPKRLAYFDKIHK